MEWSLSAVQDVIAAAVPGRDRLVFRDVRRTFGDVRRRSAGLAGFLAAHGLGARRERSGLARWECDSRSSYVTGALINVDGGTDF